MIKPYHTYSRGGQPLAQHSPIFFKPE